MKLPHIVDDAICPLPQVHGRKAVVNFRLYADDVVREPKQQRVGASCSSADTSGPSHLGAPRPLLWPLLGSH